MEMVHVLDHPLLQHKLSILRDETTGVERLPGDRGRDRHAHVLRRHPRTFPWQPVEVQTPVGKGRDLPRWPARSWPSSPSCGPAWAWSRASSP